MKAGGLLAALLLFGVTAPAFAGATPGIFEGTVYETTPAVARGWIMVQSRNGMLRRVEISRAAIVYARSIPSKDRVAEPATALVHGTEVRVTAEQDPSGEWRASRVEILRLKARGKSPPTMLFAKRGQPVAWGPFTIKICNGLQHTRASLVSGLGV